MAAEYFRQVAAIGESLGVKTDSALYLNSILRFPDVIDNTRQDIITADNWDQVDAAVDKAIDNVCDYRSREGVALYKDVTSRDNKPSPPRNDSDPASTSNPRSPFRS